MMFIKVMHDEKLRDNDPRKLFEMHSDVVRILFEPDVRIDKTWAIMTLVGGEVRRTVAEGRVFVYNNKGHTISILKPRAVARPTTSLDKISAAIQKRELAAAEDAVRKFGDPNDTVRVMMPGEQSAQVDKFLQDRDRSVELLADEVEKLVDTLREETVPKSAKPGMPSPGGHKV